MREGVLGTFLVKDALQIPLIADSLFKDASKTTSLLPSEARFSQFVIFAFHKKWGKVVAPVGIEDSSKLSPAKSTLAENRAFSARLPRMP